MRICQFVFHFCRSIGFMEIYQILLAILDKPNVPKFYRELRQYYQTIGMLHEASAVGHLIENKFEKNDNTFNCSNDNKEQ